MSWARGYARKAGLACPRRTRLAPYFEGFGTEGRRVRFFSVRRFSSSSVFGTSSSCWVRRSKRSNSVALSAGSAPLLLGSSIGEKCRRDWGCPVLAPRLRPTLQPTNCWTQTLPYVRTCLVGCSRQVPDPETLSALLEGMAERKLTKLRDGIKAELRERRSGLRPSCGWSKRRLRRSRCAAKTNPDGRCRSQDHSSAPEPIARVREGDGQACETPGGAGVPWDEGHRAQRRSGARSADPTRDTRPPTCAHA